MNRVISATATPMPNTAPTILKYRDHSIDVLSEMPYPTTRKIKETAAREPGMLVLSIAAEGYTKPVFLQGGVACFKFPHSVYNSLNPMRVSFPLFL